MQIRFVLAKCRHLILMALALGSLSASPAIAADDHASRLADYMNRLESVGFAGSILVAKDGEVLLEAAYGLADRESHRENRLETVFTIGSITKQFTAATILKLEMEGKLRVEDPITDYFDLVPDDKRDITLHHLLTHTAGFPGAIGDDFDPDATRDHFTDLALEAKLQSDPGATYNYSNVGYSLLGIIVEKVSGKGYEEFLTERLFEPAGMHRTGYLLPEFANDEMAIGYRKGDRWGTVLDHPMLLDGPCWHLRANGGIHSTAGDMYKWHLALEGNAILSTEAKKKYFHPHVSEGGDSFYGYGWTIADTDRGTRVVMHNGGNTIFAADCRRYVDEGVFYFIASNGKMSAIQVSDQIPRILFGYDYRLPPKVIALDPPQLARFEGSYALSKGGSIKVVGGDGHLVLTGRGAEAKAILAGREGSPAAAHSDLLRITDTMTRGWIGGDVTELHAALGGEMTIGEIEERNERIRQRWQQVLGDFLDLNVLDPAAGEEGVRTFAELNFEEGKRYVTYEWDGKQLVGIDLRMSAPEEASGSLIVYPIAENRFESFSLRSPRNTRVAFGPNTIEIETTNGLVKAVRAE